MDLLLTPDHYIIKQGNFTLWCDRCSGCGKMVPRDNFNLLELQGKFACIGIIYGCIGKIKFFPDGDWYLIVITKHTQLSRVQQHGIVYRIDRISLLPLTQKISYESLDLETPQNVKRSDVHAFIKEFIQDDASNRVTSKALPILHSNFDPNFDREQSKYTRKELYRRERIESRLLDALLRMFNESNNFFYSHTKDLTNSLQRKQLHNSSLCKDRNLLDEYDDRFFWNKYLLGDLFGYPEKLYSPWILALIQGFYESITCFLDIETLPSFLTKNEGGNFSTNISIDKHRSKLSDSGENEVKTVQPSIDITLISRRSRHRAGARYKRRGIDDNGNVANFVETELIILIDSQEFSYIQVRGSIPVFWSQSGHKYRPQPQLTKDFNSTHDAFKLHISDQLLYYEQETFINLVDEVGREAILKDALESHLSKLNSPFTDYLHFDFHKNSRTFENIGQKNLLQYLNKQFENYKFYWVSFRDNQFDGILCKQEGVFRVNCIDCLDRTNVVQSIIARRFFELSLMKLGLLMPDQVLPHSCIQAYRMLWANNGDAISRQYAGTAAMKGDLTRTGHRNLKGTLKDGIYSANRYYINTFKDSLRQSIIDLMQGIFPNNFSFTDSGSEEFENIQITNCLIEVIKELFSNDHPDAKCYILKEANGFKCISSVFMDDICLFFTFNFGFIVFLLESSNDFISSFEIVKYEAVEKVQFGVFNKFKLLDRKYGIRIYYSVNERSGFHYTFCSINPKPDEAKSELNQLYNKLNIITSKLKLFPLFLTTKILNQKSLLHLLPYFHDEASSEESIYQLRNYILNLNNLNHINQKFALNARSSYFSSSTDSLASPNFEVENSCGEISNKESLTSSYSESMRRSLSDTSIYSHSSNNELLCLSANIPQLSSQNCFSDSPTRSRAQTYNTKYANVLLEGKLIN